MFGENFMAFRQDAAIDEKYRLMIPKQTGVEKDETLYLSYNPDKSHLIISKCTYLLKKLEKLQKECLETDDIETYQKLSKDKEYYSSLIVQVLKVDQQKRVLLGKRIIDLMGSQSNKIFLSGQMDEVHLFKDEVQYQKLYGHTI